MIIILTAILILVVFFTIINYYYLLMIFSILKILIIIFPLLGSIAFMTLAERKIMGYLFYKMILLRLKFS